MLDKWSARAAAAAVFFLLLSVVGAPVFADIYSYRDKEGVWHFTNVEKGGRYRFFIRTNWKRPLEYLNEYDDAISRAAKRFEVHSSLIKAVIKAESDFNHKAVSDKGAKGLMQLMPCTADAMEVVNPFNPEQNIFGGTRYLSELLKRFKNNVKLALAAYNAGPEKVLKYHGVPPFPETKTFIKRVMNYYELYGSSDQ